MFIYEVYKSADGSPPSYLIYKTPSYFPNITSHVQQERKIGENFSMEETIPVILLNRAQIETMKSLMTLDIKEQHL